MTSLEAGFLRFESQKRCQEVSHTKAAGTAFEAQPAEYAAKKLAADEKSVVDCCE